MYTANDFRLYHHGVRGMHWGVRNGPPYPLDSSISTGNRLKGSREYGSLKEHRLKRAEIRAAKKQERREAKEEKKRQKEEAERQRAITSGDYETVKKFKDKMSAEELKDAVERVRLSTNLDSYKPKEDTRDKIQSAANKLDSTINLTKKGVEAWNTIAKIYNSVSSDDQLPVLEPGWAKKQQEAKKKAEEDAFVRTSSSEEFLKNAPNLSTEALLNRSNRESYLNNIRSKSAQNTNSEDKPTQEAPPPKSTKQETPPKSEPKSEPTNNHTKSTWTRDESNDFWNSSYRKENLSTPEPTQPKTPNNWSRDESNDYWSAAYRKVADHPVTALAIRNGSTALTNAIEKYAVGDGVTDIVLTKDTLSRGVETFAKIAAPATTYLLEDKSKH